MVMVNYMYPFTPLHRNICNKKPSLHPISIRLRKPNLTLNKIHPVHMNETEPNETEQKRKRGRKKITRTHNIVHIHIYWAKRYGLVFIKSVFNALSI